MFANPSRFMLVLLIVSLIVPSAALGVGLVTVVPCGAASGTNSTACSVCSLIQLAQNLLNDGIYIAVFLAAFLFAWAGWLYLTSSAGSSLERAKEVFYNVMVGLVIILAAWLVVNLLLTTLTSVAWNNLC